MYKKIFFLAAIFIFSETLNAQKLSVQVNYAIPEGGGSNNIIYYQPNQSLNWNDFIGKPVEASDAAALTNAGFGLQLAFHSVENTSQLVISVNCNFSRKDSWVKPGNKTTYILNHEQKHFDIAYIHTLLFIHSLQNAGFTNTNYESVIKKIYTETATAMSNMQNQYDRETNHSRIAHKQAEWDEKISNQLALAMKL